MVGVVAILLSAADPNLVAAEQAWAGGDYDRVLPRLDKALAHPLAKEELVRAYSLEGHALVAFDKLAPATLAFRRLLGVDARFLLEPEASPKLLAVFAEARRLGAIAPTDAAMVPEPLKPLEISLAPLPPPEPPPEPGSRWWLWTGLAVVVAGVAVGATAAYVIEKPIIPAGSLGTGQLK